MGADVQPGPWPGAGPGRPSPSQSPGAEDLPRAAAGFPILQRLGNSVTGLGRNDTGPSSSQSWQGFKSGDIKSHPAGPPPRVTSPASEQSTNVRPTPSPGPKRSILKRAGDSVSAQGAEARQD